MDRFAVFDADWNLQKSTAETTPNFDKVIVHLEVRRAVLLLAIRVLVPLVVVNFMSYAAFILPPDQAGPNLIVCAIVLYSFILFRVNIYHVFLFNCCLIHPLFSRTLFSIFVLCSLLDYNIVV